jgi:superfamily I DNA/RNA helicase
MINEFEKSDMCPKLKVAFVDEAQDLSVMQWKVVDKIKKNCEILFVAGDDDQCIYKWRGANVTCFLNLDGTREVLKKSYRVPKKIFNLANKIITRIPKSNRVQKQWTPNSEEGFIQSHYGIEEIDLSQGEWLILGADRWKLDAFETYLKENNIFHERAKRSNPIKDKYEAIDLYENKLKKGQLLSFDECYSIKKKMLKQQLDNKMFKALAKNKMYSMSDLREKYGLNTEEPWQVAFTRMGQTDTEKIDDLLRRGENLKNGARIKLATIHGVKGNECDNVVLPLSLTATAQEAYEKNPDDTHRLMYVGSTRSKKTLHLIYPESKGGYEI